eukprot:Skav220999  [mRNA]  locus=scaffold2318:115922:116486:- [translate_table: standard]
MASRRETQDLQGGLTPAHEALAKIVEAWSCGRSTHEACESVMAEMDKPRRGPDRALCIEHGQLHVAHSGQGAAVLPIGPQNGFSLVLGRVIGWPSCLLKEPSKADQLGKETSLARR